MSQVWHRMRGLANPTPATEPGGIEQNEWDPGGDVQLPDDHFSRLHNPQNGRVPPQLPSPPSRPQWPEYPRIQYSRFFRVTPALLDEQIGFQAQTVRVDNYSSHWLFLPGAGMYIPPFIYGVVANLSPGSSVAQYTIQPPTGYTDPTPVLESNVVTIWLEEMLEPVSGTPINSSFRVGAAGGANVTGNLLFSPDNTYNIGASSGNRPTNIFAANGFFGPGYYSASSFVIGINNGTQVWRADAPSGGSLLAVTDNTIDIGASGANRPRNIYAAGNIQCAAVLFNSFSYLFNGSGVPGAGMGSNGDYYLRTDTPATANQRIYVKSAGAWVGIV